MRRSLFGALAREWKSAQASLSWGQIDEMWGGLLSGWNQARSGVSVNWHTALRVSTVLACTRRLSDAASTVPWRMFVDQGEGRRKPATDHPLYDLLNSAPNEWQDSLQFRETLTIHSVLAGNGYAFLNRVGGRIVEMIPLLPDRVQPMASGNSVVYRLTAPDGSIEDIGAEDIFHLRGLSWDGFRGMDVVNLAREAIGLAMATEATHANLHANGARPSGVVSVNQKLDEAGFIRLAAWVKRHYGGLDNSSRVMVMDDGAKFTPFDMTGVDAQHIQLRGHQVEEICRVMNVLPMVIGYPAEMAARAAVETIASLHLMHTVRPLHRHWDKAGDRQLLTAKERSQGYYTKLLDGEFLRATAKDRAEYNKLALGGGGSPGWATPNEVRAWDEMDAMDGGDNLYAPSNVGPIGPDGVPRLPVQSAPAGG